MSLLFRKAAKIMVAVTTREPPPKSADLECCKTS